MTWVRLKAYSLTSLDASQNSCPSLGVSHGAGQLDGDLHRDSPLNITTKLVFYKYNKLMSHKQNLSVDKSSQTNIFTTVWACSNILYREHGVSFLFSSSRIHVLTHSWTAMLLLWIRDDVTIVAIDFEWKNVTQTNQRRDMRPTSWLTSRLNRVSMIFLCEYDLAWTRTEFQVSLGPGPSQVLSQVWSKEC